MEYDYIACLYPEGNINEQFMYLFNEEDIREVVFTGYNDEDEENGCVTYQVHNLLFLAKY